MTRAELHRAIWGVLDEGEPLVLTSHQRSDGDGVGSVLALMHAMRGRGARVRCLFQPPTPAAFDFLPGMSEAGRSAEGLPERYNLIVMDCGALDRIGPLAQRLTGRRRVVNIDHHDTNSMFGEVNYVDADASSCGEMVYGLLESAGVPLTEAMADCLFTAIVTDTGQFSHGDTTPEAFRVCALCVEAGARPDRLVQQLFLSPSPAQVCLQQMAMATLRYHGDGRVTTMRVTQEMFSQTGLGPVDTEGFSELTISIQGVEASALLKEMPGEGYVKVSMRSRDSVDVCELARSFGGGGHTHAAGYETTEGIERAEQTVAAGLLKRLGQAPAEPSIPGPQVDS